MPEEKNKRSEITLSDGSPVPARRAVGIRAALDVLLEVAPDEFRSLLALAMDRREHADPRHFESLRAHAFLRRDDLVDPVVRAVLVNSYAASQEGPVIAPLRLRDARHKAAATQAQEQFEQSFEAFWARVVGSKGKGRSRG